MPSERNWNISQIFISHEKMHFSKATAKKYPRGNSTKRGNINPFILISNWIFACFSSFMRCKLEWIYKNSFHLFILILHLDISWIQFFFLTKLSITLALLLFLFLSILYFINVCPSKKNCAKQQNKNLKIIQNANIVDTLYKTKQKMRTNCKQKK